jgi:MFS-type transporter involved in bile tolerance (Atg22 family)
MNELEELSPMILLWGIVVLLGVIVSYYGFRNYVRNRQRSMAFLASGFVLISGAAALTWFGLYFAGMNLFQCELGSTGMTATGFGAILYSLRTKAG